MISVVVPAYNESVLLRKLYARVAAAADGWREPWELVIIDDGSRDDTYDIANELAAQDSRVKLIGLARNFGHQAAVTAGLVHAVGDIVAVIDADLQDPPEELHRFIDKCKEGFDVVYAIRTKRKEGPLKRLAYFVYYRLLRSLASIDIPLDSGDFCVMSRRILDVMNALPERNRFIRGLRSWVGFRQIGLRYERQARQGGEPKYTFSKLVKLGLDGVFSFSYRPLHLMMMTGLLIAGLALIGAVGVLLLYLFDLTVMGYNPRSTAGWSSLMITLLFVLAIQLFGMGLLGEYIGRIFDEVKGRPTFIVGRTVNLALRTRNK